MSKENTYKYKEYYQSACEEIKNLRENVKGNMSLIEAKHILCNDIIGLKQYGNH